MVETPTYYDNLQHLAEPDTPGERREANSTTLADYQALWLARACEDYAHYEAPTPHGDIALAASEYLEMKVRDENRARFHVYTHTNEASTVLLDAAHHFREHGPDGMAGSVIESLMELVDVEDE